VAGRSSARRHAQAVFLIALETQRMEKWSSDLKKVAQAVADPGLVPLLESPRLSIADKQGLLKEKLHGVDALAVNFASLLVARGRRRLAGQIAEEYQRLVDAFHGIEHAQVTTAVPLESKDRERLSERLGKLVGKRVVLEARVEPGIIGGLVARVGDRLVDGSTRTRLELLRKSLSEGGAGL